MKTLRLLIMSIAGVFFLSSCAATKAPVILSPEYNAATNTGHMLYTANSGLDSVGVYSFNPITAELKSKSTVSTGSDSAPRSLIADPSHKFLFVADYGNDKISTFSIDQTTGALTLVAHTSSYSKPFSLAINATGTLLFVNFEGAKTTVAYSINSTSGALTESRVSPYSGTAAPTAMTIDSTGATAVVSTTDTLYHYTVGASGDLTSVTPSTILSLADVRLSPDGTFLAGADATMAKIYIWIMNTSSGTPLRNGLTNTTSSLMPPAALLWGARGNYVYSANWQEGEVEAFSVNLSSGLLTSIGKANAGIGCQNKSLALDPDGEYLFTACSQTGGGITAYQLGVNGIPAESGYLALSGTTVSGLAAVKLY